MSDATQLFIMELFVISMSLWSFLEERCVFYNNVWEEGPRQYLQQNVFYDSGNEDPYGLLARSVSDVSLFYC